MALETKLKIDADTKDIQRAFKSVMKSQQELSFFQQKLNKKDPFSPKNLRDSQKALDSWSKVFDNVNKVVARNNSILDMAIQRREKLMDLNTKLGRSAARDAQVERMSQVIKVRSGAKSLNQAANKTESSAQGIAGGIASLLEDDPETALVGFALQGAEAMKDFIMDSFAKGWANAKAMRDFSLLVKPGTLGGVDKFGRPYGRRDIAGSVYQDWADMFNNRDLSALGFDATALINRRSELAGSTGVVASAGLAANTLRLNKMGIDEGSIERMGLGIQAGQAGDIRSNQFNEALQRTFKTGMALDFNTPRMREFFNSVISMQASMQKTAVNTSFEEARQSMAFINAIGKQQGASALLGGRGGNFAQALAAGIGHPGGGVAGELLQMQMFGFKGNLMDYFRNLSTGLTVDKLRSIQALAGKSPIAAAISMGQDPKTSAAIFEAFGKGNVDSKNLQAALRGESYRDIKGELQARIDQTAEGRTAATLEEIKNMLEKALSLLVENLITIADVVVRYANLSTLGLGNFSLPAGDADIDRNARDMHGLLLKSVDKARKSGQPQSITVDPQAPVVSHDSSLFH